MEPGEGSPVARAQMARLWREMEEDEQQDGEEPDQVPERGDSAEATGGYDADEPEEAGVLSGVLLVCSGNAL